jgi:glycosyltransferase involved in cell wall biosynthesis
MNPDIIFLNGRFLSQTITGVQRFALEIVKALDCSDIPKEWDVVLLSPKDILYKPALKNIRIEISGRFTGQLWEQFDLPRLTRRSLLINLCNTAPLAKTRQIITIHDGAVFRYPFSFSRSFRIWYKFLQTILTRSSRKIITVSNFSKNEIIDIFKIDPTKIEIVYEGKEHILSVLPDNSILDKFDLNERPFLLSVSSLNPNKNFNAVIEAFKDLSGFNINLVITGTLNKKIFRWQENSFPENVKYLGYVTDNELRALYENAALFVFPSFYEGFGLPPLEAMSCGCPVIMSKCASLPEVGGNAVLYCDPNDPLDIAQKIKTIVVDRGVQDNLRNLGLQRIKSFSWEFAVAKIYNILQNCF